MKNKKTALYRHYDANGVLLYVGISISAINRLTQHRLSTQWVNDAVQMKTEWFDTRKEAEIAEINAINTEHPKFNKAYNKYFEEHEFSISSNDENQARCCLVAPKYLKKELKEAAQNKGISMSEFIRDLITVGVKEYKEAKANGN